MHLTIRKRIEAFAELGRQLDFVAEALKSGNSETNLKLSAARTMFEKAKNSWKKNLWFTPENVHLSIFSLLRMLEQSNLEKWAAMYPELLAEINCGSKPIGIVMAGNLPMVGFHDFLCVLISGHNFAGKLSSKDAELPVALASMLIEIEPKFKDKISFVTNDLPDCKAVIATGSDNSARYFEHAFGNIPHLFRKNRNSLAILAENETDHEIKLLGNDIFSYFGLGCRNVSKLYVPKGYDINTLKIHWKRYSNLTKHQGYNNNLTYNKALMNVGEIPFLDFGFCALKYDIDLISPISVIHIEEYDSIDLLKKGLVAQQERLQCIVGNIQSDDFQVIPFGKSQSPNLWDYADGVDTMGFLLKATNREKKSEKELFN